MAEKPGAGGKPQKYDTSTGRYSGGTSTKTADAIRKYSDEPERDLAEYGLSEKQKQEYAGQGHISEVVPKEKRTEYIQTALGVLPQKAKEYSEALYFYTDDFNHVKNIRAYQRGENVKNDLEVIRQERALEEYIQQAPKWNGGETFRGIKLTEDELKQYVVGTELDMSGTSSWSSDEDTAIGYAGYGNPPSGKLSVVFHSLTQKNGTSVRHLSPFTNEDEVLVSKRSRYRVIKATKTQDGVNHIYLEEV